MSEPRVRITHIIDGKATVGYVVSRERAADALAQAIAEITDVMGAEAPAVQAMARQGLVTGEVVLPTCKLKVEAVVFNPNNG
jgi:hypothetical protein